MSQAKVTNFFNVRKKLPDQHAAKRRKVLTDANPVGHTITKVDNDEPVKKKAIAVDKETTAVAENTDLTKVSEVVTSATDDHVLAPKTPKSSSSTAENKRSGKRASKEFTVSPSVATDKLEDNVKFTPGAGRPVVSSAKKKLDMDRKSAAATRARKVEFTKMSQLSPKKNMPQEPSFLRSEEFKVPTPVKELIGARRPLPTRKSVPKNLFSDDDSSKATAPRVRRTMRAEIETATTLVKKLTPEEIKVRLGARNKSVDIKAKLKSLIEESKKVEEMKKKRLPSRLLTPTKVSFILIILKKSSK